MLAATQKIRGSIVGVASAGETVWNPQTNRAMVVELDYLTVLGKPVREDATTQPHAQKKADAKGEGQGGSQASKSSEGEPSAKGDEAKLEGVDPSDRVGIQILDNLGQDPAEGESLTDQPGRRSEGANQGEALWRRHNVYMVALAPRTKAYCREADESANATGGRKDQSLELQEFLSRIEIGDEVEVEFEPMKSGEQTTPTTTAQTQELLDQQLRRTGGSADGGLTGAGTATDPRQAGRNGCERVYWGQAVSISLMTQGIEKEEAADRAQPRKNADGARGREESRKAGQENRGGNLAPVQKP